MVVPVASTARGCTREWGSEAVMTRLARLALNTVESDHTVVAGGTGSIEKVSSTGGVVRSVTLIQAVSACVTGPTVNVAVTRKSLVVPTASSSPSGVTRT